MIQLLKQIFLNQRRNSDAIATLILGDVKSLVAGRIESTLRSCMCRTCRHADANREISNFGNSLLSKNTAQAFGGGRCLFAIDTRQQQSELFATKTSCCVVVA